MGAYDEASAVVLGDKEEAGMSYGQGYRGEDTEFVATAFKRLLHDDTEVVAKALKLPLRLLTFPIWFAFYCWRVQKRRREMKEFAAGRARNRIINDEVVRSITLDWVKDHPDDYIFGEYDPRVPKLERTFRKLTRRK